MDVEVENFKRIREIGRGAMGEVHSAVHMPTGTPVALKFVRPTSKVAQTLLQTEILAMAKLNHPGLLYLYDTGVASDGQTYWLATELASGGSLESWQPTSWSALKTVLEPLMNALAHAHACGLVHRDLKPDNLLRALPTDLRPGIKIADFGLALVREAESKRLRAGSPAFMPPEQASPRWGDIGAWSDIYALGSTIWAMTTGQPPYGGTVKEVLHQLKHAPLPEFRPRFDVPDALAPTLHRMLAKSPDERLRSVHEVRDLLWPGRQGHQAPTSVVARVPGVGADLFDRREWRLVGRADLREQLLRSLNATRTEKMPRVLTLEGPDGVGRHRLARWLTHTAATQGLADSIHEPRNMSEVVEMARKRTVIAVCSASQPDAEMRVAAMVSSRLPILVLFIARSSEESWPLRSLPRVERMAVGPLNPNALRDFLGNELGLCPPLTLRLEPACNGIPGVAVNLVRRLVRAECLQSTPIGFDTDAPDLSVHANDLAKGKVHIYLSGCTSKEARALRLASVLGSDVLDVDWAELLTEAGTEAPLARMYKLLRHGAIRRNSDGFSWTAQFVLDELNQRPLSDEDSAAVDRFFARRLDRTDSRHLWGMNCVATGQQERARSLLLRIDTALSDATMEQQAQAVQAVRPFMAQALPTERVIFLWMELRTTLNLISGSAALPLARALIRGLGTPSHPKPFLCDVDDHVKITAWELAALVLTFQEQNEESERVLVGLEDSVHTWRSRALIATSRGQIREAQQAYSHAIRLATDVKTKGRLANGIGSMLGRLGHLKEAVEWFEVCLQWLESGQRATPLHNLALTLMLMGRFAEALPHAKAALDLAQARGMARLQGPVLSYTIAALHADEAKLANVADLALFSVRRERPSDVSLELELLEKAQPRLASSRMWVEAMTHAMRTANRDA
jgi:tetratricopeptide (TPR) repeat protein